VPAPAAGVLAEIVLDTDAEAMPGALLARIDASSTSVRAEPVEALSSTSTPSQQKQPFDKLRANGDVETRLSPSVRREPTTAQPRQFSGGDVPHDRMRRTIAENMVRAVSEAPHVTALFEADFSAVAAHKAALAVRGTKLSYTAYIVKAAAEAMAVAPAINGRWEDDRIAISPTIDVGVGTALGEKGLVVPVVKDAGTLSLEQIGAKLDELTRRAREGKLDRSDVSGGSFTISNHGVSGSLLAAPIILHQGQAAILGIGKLEKRVIVREVNGQDAMLIRPMAFVTLTIDHRVVDGHQTNAWLSRFVELIEGWPAA